MGWTGFDRAVLERQEAEEKERKSRQRRHRRVSLVWSILIAYLHHIWSRVSHIWRTGVRAQQVDKLCDRVPDLTSSCGE